MKSRVILYFGSFNPVHRGHIALAEWVVEQKLCDQIILIVSPQNPHKQSTELAPEFSRYEMCEMACAESKYPEQIKVSAIELTLERPSYTINTLRYLKQNFGSAMEFSILMGADNIAKFDTWRNYEEILAEYPIFVYPRRGYAVDKFADRITYLANAPMFDYAATDIRSAVARRESIDAMVTPSIARYILSNNLWSPTLSIAELSRQIEAGEGDTAMLRIERGAHYFRAKEFDRAIEDFREVLRIDPSNAEARNALDMIEEILKQQ